MGNFNDLFNSGQAFRGKDKPEFYEDTHNERGEYTGAQVGQSGAFHGSGTVEVPVAYKSVVVYSPRSPEDVQNLIDFLRRKEPAIINLDSAKENDAQRILDFISGAIYALNGSVHRIAGNIFLLSPEGVEITIPYSKD